LEAAAARWRRLALHIRLCKYLHMATNLAIDDRLLEEARKIGGQKTKRATVTEALHEYIQRRKQRQILELFGKIDWDAKHDYKKQRRRK
jgi:Arc/MetJ family transcription regulator